MRREITAQLLWSFLFDAVKIRLRKRTAFLKPLFLTWYVTLRCNFRCSHCSFGGNNLERDKELRGSEAVRLLEIIRRACPNIYFTGGEPLLRPDIVELVRAAKELGFSSISINTNMATIHRRMEVLDCLTNLVASFNAVDDATNARMGGISVRVARQIKENILLCAALQRQKGFLMTVNCVVTPGTIPHAREVMQFCFDHSIGFAIVPAELDGGWIDHRLRGNNDYRKLISDVIQAKKSGNGVFGSVSYLKVVRDFGTFRCYPTLTPHVYPNGDLFYPCQPMMEVAANLLEAGSYEEALWKGVERIGPVPPCKERCHKACYIEPVAFVERPWLLVREMFRSSQ